MRIAVGVVALLWGGLSLFGGGTLLLSGVEALNEPDGPWAWVAHFVGFLLAVISGVLLVQGAFAVIAAVGVLMRRTYGRVMAILLGIIWIGWGTLAVLAEDAGVIVVGGAHIAVGIGAIVVMSVTGDEFGRRREMLTGS